MITSLKLRNFKNFADETLRVGPFTLIVGANASGKSNIRDAFRFLHGIGRGYTLAEIIGGKYGTDWKPIRGAATGIARLEASKSKWNPVPFELETTMRLDFDDLSHQNTAYRIKVQHNVFRSDEFAVVAESLQIGENEVYTEDKFKDKHIIFSQPALHQISRLMPNLDFDKYLNTTIVAAEFQNTRFFDFRPDRLREPGLAGQFLLGDGGENLPNIIRNTCSDPIRKSILIEWVRELTPMDVTDFEFIDDPSGRNHLVIRETSGRQVPADSASDGTLRFLGMLAALLSENPGGLYFFEEIENGLHPSRLHLLIELIERQTAKGKVQVVATTHSPELLSIVNDDTFANMSVVCRLEDTDDAVIRRVADLPEARRLRESQGLGRLLAGGWMEDALAFTECGGEDEAK